MSTVFDIGAGVAAGAASNVLDIAFGGMKQKQQLKGQKKALEQQNAAQLDMWNKTNYEAQKEHMKAAGLNPGLLYGMSGGGGATTGSASAMPDVAQGHGMDIAGAAQLALIEAQKRNIEANTEKTKTETTKIGGVDTELAVVTIDQVRETTLKTRQEAKTEETKQALNGSLYELNRLEYDFNLRTMDTRVEATEKSTETIIQNLRVLHNAADISDATKQTQIRQITANLANSLVDLQVKKLGMEATTQGIAESKQRVTKMVADVIQGNIGLGIQAYGAETNRKAQDLQEKIKDLPDSERAILDAILAQDPLARLLKGRPNVIKGFGQGNKQPQAKKAY